MKTVVCNFCDTENDKVLLMIKYKEVHICNRCVLACMEIVMERMERVGNTMTVPFQQHG